MSDIRKIPTELTRQYYNNLHGPTPEQRNKMERLHKIAMALGKAAEISGKIMNPHGQKS